MGIELLTYKSGIVLVFNDESVNFANVLKAEHSLPNCKLYADRVAISLDGVYTNFDVDGLAGAEISLLNGEAPADNEAVFDAIVNMRK